MVLLGCEMLPAAEVILSPASVKLLGEAKCRREREFSAYFGGFSLMSEILVSDTCTQFYR